MRKPKRKIHIREKLADILDLPLESFVNIVKITMLSNMRVLIDNYEGLYLYTETEVCVIAGGKKLSIMGNDLRISAATKEQIMVTGSIRCVMYCD